MYIIRCITEKVVDNNISFKVHKGEVVGFSNCGCRTY